MGKQREGDGGKGEEGNENEKKQQHKITGIYSLLLQLTPEWLYIF